jgi:hypothetical protein
MEEDVSVKVIFVILASPLLSNNEHTFDSESPMDCDLITLVQQCVSPLNLLRVVQF